MTGWDILNRVIDSFPPLIMALMLAAVLAAAIIFIVGFSKHGAGFLQYGFKQIEVSELSVKIDGLAEKINGLDSRMDGFRMELDAIKVNHFGHLKNFLTELTSILLDKNILNNQDKARLDNQLRGM
jgi:hypothetical protein